MEETAALSRGFHAEKVYDLLGVDTVERFSGDLILRIPLGQEYHNGRVSYQFVLHYNSHSWDYVTPPDSLPPPPHCQFPSQLLSFPSGDFNAGLGWLLTLGKFGCSPSENGVCADSSLSAPDYYLTPDGGRHQSRAFAHAADPTSTGRSYTVDLTNLRFTPLPAGTPTTIYVDAPDGTRQTFEKLLAGPGIWPASPMTAAIWKLVSISDPNGNQVTIDYESTAGYPEIWHMKDGDRRHDIYFSAHPGYYGKALDHIDLAAFGGATATYRFDYKDVPIAPGGGDNGTANPYTVPLLTAITQPDGRAYKMLRPDGLTPAYDTTVPSPLVGSATSGVIDHITLPTGGSISWVFEESDVEPEVIRQACTGVALPITIRVESRTTHDTDGKTATWDYIYLARGSERCDAQCGSHPIPGGCLTPSRQLTSIALQPPLAPSTDRAASVAYFSIYSRDLCGPTVVPGRTWDRIEYGLPLTHMNTADGLAFGASPSTETRSVWDPALLGSLSDILPDPQNDPLFRRTYVRYDDNPFVQRTLSKPVPRKLRTYERTVFSTATLIDPETGSPMPAPPSGADYTHCGGAACFSETLFFNPDPFAHFRQTTTNSNLTTSFFPVTSLDAAAPTTGSPSRTVFTNYPTTLDTAGDWIIETPAEKCVADEAVARTVAIVPSGSSTSCSDLPGSAVTAFSYNHRTGALNAQRVFGGAASPTANDVLTVLEYLDRDRGNVSSESFYGGNQTLDPGDLFNPGAAPATYRIQHQYTFTQNGAGNLVNRKSSYAGFNTFTEDIDLDPSTGMTQTSRDGAGLATTSVYDSMGRVTTVAPPSPLRPTTVAFSAPNDPPSVTVTATSLMGSGTFRKEYDYDGFGRVILEKTLMPDAPNVPAGTNVSQVATAYDEGGHVASVTTQQDVASFNPSLATRYTNYDASGAAMKVIAPDGSLMLTSRNGTGHVLTTVKQGSTINLTRTTDNDAFGRLFSVREPSGPTAATAPSGADVVTKYGYDFADRLAFVDIGGTEGDQTRRFLYDRRGFLSSEQHPESGTTAYSDYDARGHVRHRVAGPAGGHFDLTFDYDAAERVMTVFDLDGSGTRRPLKEYSYSDANAPGDYSAGKLHSAARHNYLASGDAKVTETYTYGGSGGAISHKETLFQMPGVASQTFRSNFTYDDLGSLASIDYPACTPSCGGAAAIGTVLRSYNNTRLSEVKTSDGQFNTIVFGALSYNANGTLGAVRHQGNVVDTYAPDPTGMPRPHSIDVTGFCVGPALNAAEPADQSITSGGQATLTMTSIAGAQYAWYQGQSGDTSHPVNNNNAGASFTTPVLTANTSYWARVTAADSTGQRCSSDSRTATVNVKPCTAFSIVTQPQDLYMSAGHAATLSVAASGVANLTYQWYEGVSGNTSRLLAGKTASTLTTDILGTTTSYWVRITAAACVRDSATATVHICHAPLITVPPASQTIGVPDNQTVAATLSVTATGDNLTYAWTEITGGTESAVLSNLPVLSVDIGGTAARTFKVTVRNDGSGLPGDCTGITSATATLTPTSCNVSFYNVQGNVTIFPGSNTFPLSVGVWADNHVRFDWYHGTNGNVVHFAGLSYTDHQIQDPAFPDDPTKKITVTGPTDFFGQCAATQCPTMLAQGVILNTVSGALNAPYDVYWCVVKRTDVNCGNGVSTPKIYVSYAQSCPLPPVTLSGDIVLNPGGSGVINAVADWPRLTYQWYRGQSGDTTHLLPGETRSSLNVSSSINRYWCRVTNECGTAHEDSADAAVSVQMQHKLCTPPVIVQQPQSAEIAAGASALLSIDATSINTPLHYTWLVEGPGDPIPNPEARQVTVTPRMSTKYYAKITNDVQGDECQISVESARAIIRIRSCSSINLTSEPTSVSIFSGLTATLQVVASSSETIQYQWYRGVDGDVTASTLIGGATLPSYTTPALTATTSYWVRMTTASCTIDSTAAVVQVCDPPVITSQPLGGNLTAGQAFFFDASATGSDLRIEWHQGTPQHEGPTIGIGGTFYFAPPDTDTYFFKAISDCGGTPVVATSNTITVTVCRPPSIDVPPASTTVFVGKTATLHVTATEGLSSPIVYQWSEVGGGNVGTNSPTFTTPPMTAEKSYIVRVQSGICAVESEPATVSLCELPEVLESGQSYNITSGGSVVLDARSGSAAPTTYTWYSGHSGDVAGSTMINVSAAGTLTVHPTVTTSYWATVDRGGCVSRTTDSVVNICIPTITNQPAPPQPGDDIYVPGGAPAHLSVNASEAASYQWYAGARSDTTNPVAGATSALLSVSPAADTNYWVRVTGSCGVPVDSLAALVRVCQPPVITAQPAGAFIVLGTQARLAATATGTDAAFQWYAGPVGTTTTPVAATAVTNVAPANTTTYWVRVTTKCGTQDSSAAVVHVCTNPVITQPPADVTIFNGATAQLSVAAQQSTNEPLAYQWYAGASGDTSTPVAGATSATMTTPPLTATTTYWVRVIGGPLCVPADSAAATVNVCKYPQNVAISPDVNTTFGQTVRLTAVSDPASTYTWYQGNAGDTTTILTYTANAFLDVSPTATTRYWYQMRNGSCTSNSPATTVNVCVPSITTPASGPANPINSGSAATLTVAANTAGVTYQWYTGASGDTSHPIAGATSPSVTVNPTATTSYWARATGTCGRSADSGTVTVTVCATTTITSVSPSQWITPGNTVLLSISATGTNLHDQWYIGASGDTSQPIAGATGTSYSATPASTTSYWVLVSSTCGNVNSATMTVSVCAPPVIKTSPQSAQVYANGTAMLSVTATEATATPMSYQWYRGAAGDVSTPVGTNAPTFTTPALTATTSYWVRVSDGGCTPADSAAAVVTVNACPASVAAAADVQSSVSQSVTLAVPASVIGTPQSSLQLSGSSYLTVPSSPALDVSGALTLEAWVKINTVGAAQAVVERFGPVNSSSGGYALRITTAGKLHFFIGYDGGTSDTLDGATTIAPGQWHHVAGVYGGSQMRVYVDGVLDGTKTTSALPGTGTANLIIGAAGNDATGGALLNGWIDEVRLTADALYYTSFAPAQHLASSAATRGLWKFDGQTLADSANGAGNASAVGGLHYAEDVPGAKLYTWYQGASGDTTHPLTSSVAATTVSVSPAATTQYWYQLRDGACTTNSATTTVSVCVPQFTTQPANTNITSGQSATLTAAANTAGVAYQWYTGTSGVTTSPIAGATSASVVVTPSATTSYWVRATSTCGRTADSSTATVSVCQPPTVTALTPTISSTTPGTIVTLRASGNGTNITYQWYTGSSGDTSSPINTATQSTCNVSPSNTTNYWVRVSGCGTANSTTMTVFVCATPSITAQPASQTIYYNTAATMSVTATESTTTAITYQWYRGATGDVSAPIAGATATTYTTPVLTATTSYWVRVTAGNCFADSATATVTVCAFTATVGSPSTIQTSVGQSTTISSPVGGTRYAFYQGASGDQTHPLTGWTNSSTTIVAPTATTSYWNQVDNGVCVANGATVTVNVCVPQFTTQPASQTVVGGQSATLTSAANTAGVTYQWYVGASGVTTSPVAGATASSLTVTPAANTSYWVRATSSCGRTVDSATATITLCSPPSISIQPSSIVVASGQSATLRVTAAGSGINYQWFYGQSGDTTTPVNTATGSTVTVAVSTTTYFWVRVNGQCGTINSTAAAVSIAPQIGTQPQSISVGSGSSATLTVAATGSYLHYKWYYANGNLIPGAPDAPSYTISSVTAPVDIFCSVSSGAAYTNSNTASITLCDGIQFGGPYVQNNGGCNRYVAISMSGGWPDSYAWYKGARGDVSTPVGNSSTLLICIPGPTTVWVRVSTQDPNTGLECYSDSPAINVQ